MTGMHDVDVLIAGGGPVGLTASILLSRFGVTSVLVERHPGTSLHPKARGINARTMEIFGASYESSGVIPDGTQPPAIANPVTDYVPTGRPGARAPHVWLERAGGQLSTLDLFGEGFVLLAGSRGAAWRDAAVAVASELAVPLTAFTTSRRRSGDSSPRPTDRTPQASPCVAERGLDPVPCMATARIGFAHSGICASTPDRMSLPRTMCRTSSGSGAVPVRGSASALLS